jgi:hypothetical protein
MTPDALHTTLTGWALTLLPGAASAATGAHPDPSRWQQKFIDPEDGRLGLTIPFSIFSSVTRAFGREL